MQGTLFCYIEFSIKSSTVSEMSLIGEGDRLQAV